MSGPLSEIGAKLLTALGDEWDDPSRIASVAGVATRVPGQPLAALVRNGYAESRIGPRGSTQYRLLRQGSAPTQGQSYAQQCDEARAEVAKVRGELWQAQHGQLKWCRSELAGARALLDEAMTYAEHASWRCAHPPHYYLTDESFHGEMCPCGLDDFRAKVRAALGEASPEREGGQ